MTQKIHKGTSKLINAKLTEPLFLILEGVVVDRLKGDR
jgi:hypothetical protein